MIKSRTCVDTEYVYGSVVSTEYGHGCVRTHVRSFSAGFVTLTENIHSCIRIRFDDIITNANISMHVVVLDCLDALTAVIELDNQCQLLKVLDFFDDTLTNIIIPVHIARIWPRGTSRCRNSTCPWWSVTIGGACRRRWLALKIPPRMPLVPCTSRRLRLQMLQSYTAMVECDDRRRLLKVLYCFDDTSTSVNTWHVMQNQRHTWIWLNVVMMELHDQHPVNMLIVCQGREV